MNQIEKLNDEIDPDIKKFIDDHYELLQKVQSLYLHLAGNHDLQGFEMLNLFVSIASQHALNIINKTESQVMQ